MKNCKMLVLFAGLFLLAVSCSKDAAESAVDGGRSGSITRFAVHNGYMYALNPNQVKTYSLQNPDQPRLVHTLRTLYGLETIIIYDNTIYLGSRSALYILSIADPAAPEILAATQRLDFFLGGCDPVVVKDNYAYSTVKIIENVCGRSAARSALLVYDVTDKNNPVNVGLYWLGLPNGLGYKGNYLFICDEENDRVEVFDISNPRNLKWETGYSVPITDPVDLIVDGERMIVSAKTEFRFFDISDVANIRQLGRIAK